MEEWTSTEEETISEPVYQHYRYKLGIARYFMEYYDMEVKEYESGEYSTSQLGVPVITMYHTGLAGQCIQSI